MVLKAADFSVVEGVNLGDPLSFADELVLEDVYQQADDAALHRLKMAANASGDGFFVAKESDIGVPEADLVLDSVLTIMNRDGEALEVVVIVEVIDGGAEAVYALPLGQMSPGASYALVGLERSSVMEALADVACVAFARGTKITLESGAQCAIEDLAPGDRVLTRDDGPKEIRWIGCSTLRATGAQAPVLIKAGALNNLGDLRLSPEHRLFVYQRTDRLGAGRSEIFVKARHLVNGTSILQEPGGFIDYYQILFDDHHIIYAEGIAAEPMLLPPTVEHTLPNQMKATVGNGLRKKREGLHKSFELTEAEVRRDTADLLRRASMR